MTTQIVNRLGRQEKPVDWEEVNKMLEAGCDGVEIAAQFRIHPDTLYDKVQKKYGVTFTVYSASIDSVGKAKLKKAQFEKAIGERKKGDTTLLLHLGRTRLKQVDAQPEKISDSAPNDANLNAFDALIKAEGEKLAMAKKIEELEKKIDNLMNQPQIAYPIPFPPLPPSYIEPPYTVTCNTGNNDSTQSEANPVLQRSDEEVQYMGGCCKIGQNLFKHSEADQHH